MTSMVADGVQRTRTESNDWQAFVVTLDHDVLRRFDDVVCQLPSAISPHAVILHIDALIKGTGIAYGRNGYADWGAYVDDVLELARLRHSLRAWFFERGGYEDPHLNAYIANLVLDSRTRLLHKPSGAEAGERPRSPVARAFTVAVPAAFLLVTLLALLSVAMTMAFRDVIGTRDATAAVALCLAVAMLAIGGIASAIRSGYIGGHQAMADVVPAPASKSAQAGMLVTRDSVCMADDADAPHATRIAIDPDADALAVADAILRAGYLPSVAGGSTWSLGLGDTPDADAAVFGHSPGHSFSHRVNEGSATLRSMGVTRLELRYHRQDRPDDVIGGLAMARIEARHAIAPDGSGALGQET